MATKPRLWNPDRRSVRAIALYNGSEDHEWGLHPNWWRYGVPWLYQTMKDSYARGFRRFMWSLPAGRKNQPHVPWPSAQWQLLNTCGIATLSATSTVQQDLAQCITPLLSSDPDIQLIIYLGGVIKSATDRDVAGAGIGLVWVLGHEQSLNQLMIKTIAVTLGSGVVFWVATAVFASSAPGASASPFTIMLAGAVMPLCVLIAALWPRFAREEKHHG